MHNTDFEYNFGLKISCNNAEAEMQYWQGVRAAICANADAETYFENAILLSPNLAIAYADAAIIYQMWGNTLKCKAYLTIANNPNTTCADWEKSHIDVISRIINGEGLQALAALYEHVKKHPTDAFVLSQVTGAYGILAFSGNSQFDKLRYELLQTVEKHYHSHFWFNSMYAFSLTEIGMHEDALRYAEKSLERYPNSGHLAHSYSHVLYETGKHKETVSFLEKWLPNFPDHAPIAGHNHWHHALANLKIGNYEKAYNIYNLSLSLSHCKSPDYGKFVDAVTLLWRSVLAQHHTVDFTLEFDELYKYASQKFGANADPFKDIHWIIAAIGSGDKKNIEEVKYHVNTCYSNEESGINQLITSLFSCMELYYSKQYAKANNRFNTVITQISALGGSRAQRDILKETMYSN